MIERTANLWDKEFDSYLRVITTNGFVKKDGSCVMGRGCAREAKEKYRGLEFELGFEIKEHGNRLYYFPEYKLLTFPVKHLWMQDADILLIQRSAEQLVAFHSILPLKETKVVLPRPGCGNGGLNWADVKLVLAEILNTDDYVIVNFKDGE